MIIISTDINVYNELERILDKVKMNANLSGIILASKDGKLISKSINSNLEISEFIAMCASTMKSAEHLGDSMNNREITKIVTELEKRTLIMKKSTESTFLILILHNKSKITSIYSNLDEIIKEIKIFVNKLDL